MEKKDLSEFLRAITEDSEGSDDTISQYSFQKPQMMPRDFIKQQKVVQPVRRSTFKKGSVKSTLSKRSNIGNKVGSPETSVEEFLQFFTEKHPLFKHNLSNFIALVKGEDFLYETELLVIQRLDAFLKDEPNRGVTLRLKEHFHFVAPVDDG
jgi:hypothetical protein